MDHNDFSINPAASGDISINIGDPAAALPVAAVSPVSAEPPKQESVYGEIPPVPVMDAVEGIKFDFNDGIRILFPQNRKEYHVTFSDIDTGIILFSQDTVPGAFVTSVKKF